MNTGQPSDARSLGLTHRLRRNRRTEWARRMVRENVVTVDDLIWPLFLVEGERQRVPVPSMPGVERLSIDEAVRRRGRPPTLASPPCASFP